MKDYTMCVIRCHCSHVMRIGKLVKAFRYMPERKRCPNCGKNLSLQILKKKSVRQKVLIR